MEKSNKSFWRESFKGGAVTGLVLIGFALLRHAAETAGMRVWERVTTTLSFIVVMGLIYAFSKKYFGAVSPDKEPSFAQLTRFTAAMGLFVAILGIFYVIIFNIIVK